MCDRDFASSSGNSPPIHPEVAEEARNLLSSLSMKNENLNGQSTQTLLQTNSDQM